MLDRALSGLLLLATPVASPTYEKVSFETACDENMLTFVYRDGPSIRDSGGKIDQQFGMIDQIAVNGVEVPNAAGAIMVRVAGRPIDSVDVYQCAVAEGLRGFRGVIKTSEASSKVHGLKPDVFFNLSRIQGGWRLALD